MRTSEQRNIEHRRTLCHKLLPLTTDCNENRTPPRQQVMSHQDGLGSSARNKIHEITGAQIQALTAKLSVLLPFLPPVRLQEILSKDDFTPGEATGSGGGRHVLQEASILGHLRRINALNKDTAVAIELGAGTARLSDRLQRVTEAKLKHVLVDRQIFQKGQSRDRAMAARDKTRPNAVTRVVVDIASFDLNEHCNNTNNTCLCMSKHLCGPACDLAVAAVGRTLPKFRPPCALATCCHYLCTWDSFSGKKFWCSLGLSEDDFAAAAAASQWASLKQPNSPQFSHLGTSSSKVDIDVSVDVNVDVSANALLPDLDELARTAGAALAAHDEPPSKMSSEEFERSFTRNEKGKLGMQLKQLLDLARVARMQELGYCVELVRYTTRSIEDRLLIASTIAH